MKIFLAGSCPVTVNHFAPIMVDAFRQMAARDSVRHHAVVGSPEEADLILFVDNHMNPDWRPKTMLGHPLMRQFPGKCMVYEERDHPWLCPLPGVYVSMPARYFDAGSHRAWAYYALSDRTAAEVGTMPDMLYSFMGSPGPRTSGGYRPRLAILALRDDRALIEDSSGFVFYDDRGDPAAHASRQRRFAEAIGRSKFVLCPRGVGTSSFRLFETMRAGRLPVVIADQWVAPKGPDWGKCSLRIPENAVAEIPERLRAAEGEWEALSAVAKAEYHRWFAPEVNFHNIIEQCRSLAESGRRVDGNPRRLCYRDIARQCRLICARARASAGRTLRRVGLRG